MKKLRKSVYICQSYQKNKSGTFFYGPWCIVTLMLVDVEPLLSYKPFKSTESQCPTATKIRNSKVTWEEPCRRPHVENLISYNGSIWDMPHISPFPLRVLHFSYRPIIALFKGLREI